MPKNIYLDNHATTAVDPQVLDAMLPYFTERFGNAASKSHPFGWEATEAVELAREQIAKAINAKPEEIIFTSGATESNNIAVKGTCLKHSAKGKHLITVATEHKAVLDCCMRMEQDGFETTYLGVDADGLISLDELKAALRDDTILISVMTANNETGVLQPITEIGKIARDRGILFHSDAVQAIGKIPFDVASMNVDMASITAHKVYGPKGVGALYVRSRNPRVRLASLIDGGGHERGLRSGTLNVPGIVGLGKALEIAAQELQDESKRIFKFREKLLKGILDIGAVRINGSLEHRLPANVNASFDFVEGESLLMGLDDIALSSGSACSSATVEPSHVLAAMGLTVDQAHSSLRFGIGRFNTEEEIDYTIKRVAEVVGRLREMSPLYELAKQGIVAKD